MSDKINMNSLVLMHYSIALTNGSIIESSFDDQPVELNMGSGDVTEGMELAIFGLKEGDSQTLTLTPEQGFGTRDEFTTCHLLIFLKNCLQNPAYLILLNHPMAKKFQELC